MKKRYKSIYAPYISEFIAMKKQLGYKYVTSENVYLQIDNFFLEYANIEIGITKEVADQWCKNRKNESEMSKYHRIIYLKQFSEHLNNLGFTCYIPQLPKYPESTFMPYIFSYEEMAKIFKVCDELRLERRNTQSSLLIMPCLLRMLYGTGIRISEALSLKNESVNIEENYLTIKDSKSKKDRLVPITSTLADVCKEYIKFRRQLPIMGVEEATRCFFVSPLGLNCNSLSIRVLFQKILIRSGIPSMGSKTNPRIHDIRHSFACHSFVKLCDEGIDLYCSWPYLSTYLGHETLSMTERYIRFTEQMYPELLKHSAGLYVNIISDNEENKNEKS
jgi:integrase/recombinase XerD